MRRRLKRFFRAILRYAIFFPLLIALGWKVLIWYSEKTNRYQNFVFPSGDEKTIDGNHINEIRNARQQVMNMMYEREIPGLSVSVSKNGQIIWSEAFGYADVEKKTVVRPSNQFRTQSVSKPLSVLAMVILYEQGKLDIDEDIRKYIPEFPDKGYKITPRLLSTHRSGIRNYQDDLEAIEAKKYGSLIEGLGKFKDDPLIFPPGERFLYSTFNYWLLNAAIERASGMPFQQYLEEYIFKPLEMGATTVATSQDTLPNQVHFYDNSTPYSRDGSMVISPPYPSSYLYELSTADDLVRFANAHLNTSKIDFIDNDTKKMIFRSYSRHLFIIGYGMGWMSARDLHLRQARFHFGAGSGGTSLLAIFPGQEVCISMLANLGHAKFPFNRLMNIANSFLWSPGTLVFWMVIGVYVLFAFRMINRWRRHQTVHGLLYYRTA